MRQLQHTAYVLGNIKDGGLMYCVLAPSAREAWAQALEDEVMGTGHTRATLRRRGWRAMKVLVSTPGPFGFLS